jgi:mannosyltransferase
LQTPLRFSRSHLRRIAPIARLTALAALLRFPTVAVQSYEGDELYTVWLVRMGFDKMVETVPRTESTPHLYYLLAWIWGRIFGTGEVGLRSLSALLGTAAVPIAGEVGRKLVSRRAGILAAALVAVNPLLVWYSQEARAYALLIFLAGFSLLFFVRALKDGRPRDIWGWALVSALALATHYFAAFLIAPEALWLVRARGRLALLSAALPTVTATALVPLAIHQRALGNAGRERSLGVRAAQIPKNFLVGFNGPAEIATTLTSAGLVLLALSLLVVRARHQERRGAALAASLAAVAIGVPFVLALAGADYLDSKNVIGAVLPCALVAGTGFAATRTGLAAAGVLCGLCIALVLTVAADPRYQRLDWRGASRALGQPTAERAIVITRALSSELLRFYLPGLHAMPERGVPVEEIDVVGLATLGRYGAGPPRPPRPVSLEPPPDFTLAGLRETPTYTLLRFRARAPVRLSSRALSDLSLERDPSVLLQTQQPRTREAVLAKAAGESTNRSTGSSP